MTQPPAMQASELKTANVTMTPLVVGCLAKPGFRWAEMLSQALLISLESVAEISDLQIYSSSSETQASLPNPTTVRVLTTTDHSRRELRQTHPLCRCRGGQLRKPRLPAYFPAENTTAVLGCLLLSFVFVATGNNRPQFIFQENPGRSQMMTPVVTNIKAVLCLDINTGRFWQALHILGKGDAQSSPYGHPPPDLFVLCNFYFQHTHSLLYTHPSWR